MGGGGRRVARRAAGSNSCGSKIGVQRTLPMLLQPARCCSSCLLLAAAAAAAAAAGFDFWDSAWITGRMLGVGSKINRHFPLYFN